MWCGVKILQKTIRKNALDPVAERRRKKKNKNRRKLNQSNDPVWQFRLLGKNEEQGDFQEMGILGILVKRKNPEHEECREYVRNEECGENGNTGYMGNGTMWENIGNSRNIEKIWRLGKCGMWGN